MSIGFRLTLTGEFGTPYTIQCSTNLADWTPIGTVPNTWGTVQFTDPEAATNRHRFYRAAPAPTNMALIPAGSFVMGDTFSEGYSNEIPLHTNYVSAFYMDKREVTKVLWVDVYQWAITYGYGFYGAGYGKATNHPVQDINWYECVKWCNARSEKEGRVPAYYTDAAQTTVYRTGRTDLQNDWVKWTADYRLPTEAEWEKAARGGSSGHRFPWPDVDTISHRRANYGADTSRIYDVSPTVGYHPDYDDGVDPYTSPVGSFAANVSRCASRLGSPPLFASHITGFRCVRGLCFCSFTLLEWKSGSDMAR